MTRNFLYAWNWQSTLTTYQYILVYHIFIRDKIKFKYNILINTYLKLLDLNCSILVHLALWHLDPFPLAQISILRTILSKSMETINKLFKQLAYIMIEGMVLICLISLLLTQNLDDLFIAFQWKVPLMS